MFIVLHIINLASITQLLILKLRIGMAIMQIMQIPLMTLMMKLIEFNVVQFFKNHFAVNHFTLATTLEYINFLIYSIIGYFILFGVTINTAKRNNHSNLIR